MKKRLLSLLCLCALLGSLVGAAPAAVASGSLQFRVLPVTEAGVRTLYGWEGYQVVKLTPYQGDYLVEYTNYRTTDDQVATLLDWVFGATGRRVQLGSMEYYTGYRITTPGQVEATTTGASAATPWKGMPETLHYTVLGGADGVLSDGWGSCQTSSETTWQDPAQPLYTGWWGGDGAPADEAADSGRYEQLYDARMDADGLSFSFIPSGDPDRFFSFFPAVTTTPALKTAYDQQTGTFTLRLYNTCLKSGGITPEAMKDYFGGLSVPYGGITYPYAFPAGSLGRDSHFLKNVQVQADGEDVVVTATLTDRAYRFTVETGNLGYDSIPFLRIVFREYNNDMDKT